MRERNESTQDAESACVNSVRTCVLVRRPTPDRTTGDLYPLEGGGSDDISGHASVVAVVVHGDQHHVDDQDPGGAVQERPDHGRSRQSSALQ